MDGTARFISKQEVYRRAAAMRMLCGLSLDDYPICLRTACAGLNLAVEELPLRTHGLRGIAIPGGPGESDIILLSQARNSEEHMFDFAHEWYHLCQHRGVRPSFNCLEHGTPAADLALEWQANEGGAELIVPYGLLIPRIVSDYGYLCSSWQAISDFKREQAERFGVTEGVIKFRLESLRYEIAQAAEGVELEQLHIWSAARQAQEGIRVESLNAMELRMYQARQRISFARTQPRYRPEVRRYAYTQELRWRDQDRVAELHREWLSPG